MPFLAPIAAAGAAVATGFGASAATAAAVGGFTTLLAGGGLAFAGIKAVGSLLKGPEAPSAPASTAAAATGPSSAAEIQKQADITAQKNKLDLARRKRTGTTLTSPQGLLSTEQTSQKTLLGG